MSNLNDEWGYRLKQFFGLLDLFFGGQERQKRRNPGENMRQRSVSGD